MACVFGHFCTLKMKKSRNSASGGDALRAVLNGIFFGSMLLLNTAKNGTHNLFVFAVLKARS